MTEERINIEEFLKERDETLLSLDEDRIRAYMKKYDIPAPLDEFSDSIRLRPVQLSVLTPL